MLFEAVLVRLDHEFEFPFQRLLRSITYERFDWPTATEEDQCRGSHDTEFCGQLIVTLVRQYIQFGELQLTRILLSQLGVDRIEVLTPDTCVMPEVNENWYA